MVPAYYQEVLAIQEFLRILDTPGSTELGLFMHVGDIDPEEGTVTKGVLDHFPHVTERDNHFTEP
jgi:hypothetical protein